MVPNDRVVFDCTSPSPLGTSRFTYAIPFDGACATLASVAAPRFELAPFSVRTAVMSGLVAEPWSIEEFEHGSASVWFTPVVSAQGFAGLG